MEMAAKFGTVNVWDLYDLEERRAIPLAHNQVMKFLHLIHSPSSALAEALSWGVGGAGAGWATLRVWGPIVDEAIHHGRTLKVDEAQGHTPYTGFEYQRLWADFRLFRSSLPLYLPSQQAKDELVARLYELRLAKLAEVSHTLALRCLDRDKHGGTENKHLTEVNPRVTLQG